MGGEAFPAAVQTPGTLPCSAGVARRRRGYQAIGALSVPPEGPERAVLQSRPAGASIEEILDGHTDITADQPEEARRYVLTLVVRHGSDPPIRMPVTPVRTSAAHFHESESFEDRDNLARLEGGQRAHVSIHGDSLDPYQLALQIGLAVFQQKLDDFAQVFLQLLDRRALGMGARKTRDMAHIEAGCRIALDDGLE